MASKTRTKIVKTAKKMFNERRYGNVSTLAIAREIEISEGNVWYYFNNKRDLLDEITTEFLEVVDRRLAILPTGSDDVLQQYAKMLATLVEEFRNYGFIYRDQADFGEHADELQLRLPKIYADGIEQGRAFYQAMIDADLLDWPEERLVTLSTNVTIILRYDLEFQRESGTDKQGGDPIANTIEQHFSLFEHAMRPDALVRLKEYISQTNIHVQ
ncbi:TetR/AcrR family transcriptional regulator [Parasphingorhabdus sp.]|uniref:TetR/AcrR family transcriptional regulator n=1 Tax=Parasphingorhabdus sp. TaxID=2709688 RepID=UPI003C72F6C7